MLVQKRFVVWVKRVDVVCIMRFVVKQLCIMRFGVCIMRFRYLHHAFRCLRRRARRRCLRERFCCLRSASPLFAGALSQ